MRYKVTAAVAGLFLLAGCDDPKPSADNGRDVGAPSQMSGSSAQQGTARETPANTMMQQGGAGGNAQTMQQGTAMQPQQDRIGPRGEPMAGTQPGPSRETKPDSPVPGQ